MSELILEKHEYCQLLADHIKESVNRQYLAVVEKKRAANPETSFSDKIVIQTTRNFDDPSVPLSAFPLLKVFRNQDTFDGVTPYSMTSATISYSVAYPDLQELPDLLYWASWAINQALIEWSYDHNDTFDLKNNNRRTFQYLLTVNEVTQAIYPFIRASILFKDNLTVCAIS